MVQRRRVSRLHAKQSQGQARLVTATQSGEGCRALLHRTWERTPINGRLFSSRVALVLRVIPRAHPSEGVSRAQEALLRKQPSGE